MLSNIMISPSRPSHKKQSDIYSLYQISNASTSYLQNKSSAIDIYPYQVGHSIDQIKTSYSSYNVDVEDMNEVLVMVNPVWNCEFIVRQ